MWHMKRREFVKFLGATGILACVGDSFALPPSLNFNSKRIALVIGNAKYKENPLDNSVNDSDAVSDQLKRYGFDVILLNDGTKQDMLDATSSYGAQIRKNSATGLFYYAGHAVQFDWKNYLVPIDAKVARINDVPSSCYDLSDLFSVIKEAKNPANFIILDSCRDNPFGQKLAVASKGLSQFDAPEKSLLAYATAPGHVASDGSSAHGLYTETLLNEMQVKDAKIEDVLKRVRLKVRIASNGKQVPWETTSLETDFSFNTPEFSSPNHLGKLVRVNDVRPTQIQSAEAGVKIPMPVTAMQTPSQTSWLSLPQSNSGLSAENEKIEWQSVAQSKNYKKIEEFLYKYPSGEYSMIAQAKLNDLLREQGQSEVKPISSLNNPNSKGTVIGLRSFSVGDSFTYEVRDIFNNMLQRKYTSKVTGIKSQIVELDGGKSYYSQIGNKTNLSGDVDGFLQRFPYEYQIGNSWTSTYINDKGNTAQAILRVADRKIIKTPFGTFNAFLIEGTGQIYRFSNRVSYEWWIDPEKCSFPLSGKIVSQHSGGFNTAEIHTLVDFQQSKS